MRFFALMKENARHRSWEIVLSVFAFVVILPITFWLYLAKMDMDHSSAELFELAQKFADHYFRECNPWVIGVTILLSLVSGVRGMTFVFHKPEMDFYHSLPVKREGLYMISYMNTMLFYMVPFVVTTAMSVVIVKLYAPEVNISGRTLLANMIIHLLGYFMLCNIHIFIVMVTGRTILALLGIVGVYFIGIIYYYVGVLYVGVYFTCIPVLEVPKNILRLLCPPLNYMFCCPKVTPEQYPMVLIMVVVGMMAFLISFLLYCRRPSEAAGTGIVYRVLKNVIKVVLNTLCGIVGMLIFYYISYFTMLKFTTLLGAVLLAFCMLAGYVVLQLILELDIKTCRRDVRVFLVSVGFTLFWMVFFQYDIFLINGYIPEAEKVETVAFAFTSDEDSSYRLEHMKSEDVNTIITLAERGLKESQKQDFTGVVFDQDNYQFSISYNLKNGKKMIRNYVGNNTEEFKELIEVIMDSKEYKKATYVFDTYDYGEIMVNLFDDSQGELEEHSLYGKEKRIMLLDALRKDLEHISLKDMEDEVTLGQIVLQLPKEELNDYSRYIEYRFTESYVHVIAALKELGIMNVTDAI